MVEYPFCAPPLCRPRRPRDKKNQRAAVFLSRSCVRWREHSRWTWVFLEHMQRSWCVCLRNCLHFLSWQERAGWSPQILHNCLRCIFKIHFLLRWAAVMRITRTLANLLDGVKHFPFIGVNAIESKQPPA